MHTYKIIGKYELRDTENHSDQFVVFPIINAVMHQKLVQRGNTITDGANVAITQMGERYSMYLVCTSKYLLLDNCTYSTSV